MSVSVKVGRSLSAGLVAATSAAVAGYANLAELDRLLLLMLDRDDEWDHLDADADADVDDDGEHVHDATVVLDEAICSPLLLLELFDAPFESELGPALGSERSALPALYDVDILYEQLGNVAAVAGGFH